MSAAREEILGRIRDALRDRPQPEPVIELPQAQRSSDDAADLVARFAERVGDYRAAVDTVARPDAAAAIAAACERHDVAELAVPDGFPADWVPSGLTVHSIASAGSDEIDALDRVDGVLTTCALAIAETGTIVLDAGAGQGPRAATLIPDLHVCVVDAADVVPGVSEAIAALADTVARDRRPLTFISGPSATSDIELDRVEGVHGPRRLEVVIVHGG